MFPTPQPIYGCSPGECYNTTPQQIMQQSSLQTIHHPPEKQIPVQQISPSSQYVMPTQQTNYPTYSINIPQTHQQTNQHLLQQSTSKLLPTEDDSDNDIGEMPETEMESTNKQPWQVLKKRKRNKTSPEVTQVRVPFQIKTQNRFEKFTQPSEVDIPFNRTNITPTNPEDTTINHKPPPIFIYGVTNYNKMVEYLTTAVKEEQYYCKTQSNGTIRVNTSTSDSYRRLIKLLQHDNIVYHTYQLREERAYRVVIRYLHPSIPAEAIKQEIVKHGHTVRNVTNILHRATKEPLPMHFVDLEPKENNKTIYNIDFICNTIITVEAPRKKNIISQCTRCQNYRHTKTYCTRPFMCVKCGGDHNTTICRKDSNTPATC